MGAEAAAASALAFLSAAMASAYAADWVGLPIAPLAVLAVSAAAAIGTFAALRGAAARDPGAAAAFAAIVAAAFAALLLRARTNELLPTSSGPDLVHHLALIGYIERHWRLVHDVRLSEYLGEMIDYTPGVHLLAALAGAWLRRDGLHVVYTVVACTCALKAGLVFLIARRFVPATASRNAFAALAVALLLVPYRYSIASFTEQSYYAQVVSELFALAMWWTTIVWDERPWAAAPPLFALFGVAAFLAWPVWIGPAVVTFAVVVLAHGERSIGDRAADFAIAAAPIAAIGAMHAVRHPGGFRMAGTGGFAIWPTPSEVGWWFYAPAAAASLFAVTRRRTRTIAVLLVAIALQAAALAMTARAAGAAAPYLALKMFYLAIYPIAIAIAALLAWLAGRAAARAPRIGSPAVAWAIAAIVAVAAMRPIASARRPAPVVTAPVLRAGEWALARFSPECVDYLTRDGYTAYWLHLAVFGQPRASGRAMHDETFEPQKALVRWILPGSLPYAITDDLDALPRDIRGNVDVLQQFGRAAVVARRGSSPASCP